LRRKGYLRAGAPRIASRQGIAASIISGHHFR